MEVEFEKETYVYHRLFVCCELPYQPPLLIRTGEDRMRLQQFEHTIHGSDYMTHLGFEFF